MKKIFHLCMNKFDFGSQAWLRLISNGSLKREKLENDKIQCIIFLSPPLHCICLYASKASDDDGSWKVRKHVLAHQYCL